MIDRRGVLGLAAAAPLLGMAGEAEACTYALGSHETFAARLSAAQRLFEAWFQRDALNFLGPILGPRPADGSTPSEDFVRRAISVNANQGPRELFDTMFLDREVSKRVVSLYTIGPKLIAVAREDRLLEPLTSCSDTPTMHMFMLDYTGPVAGPAERPSDIELLHSGVNGAGFRSASWSAG